MLFFSIFSFFSGVVVLTVSRIICQTSEEQIYHKLKIYHWVFTCYTLTIFVFYYDKIFIYGNAALILSYIGNLLLAVLNLSYAGLILELNRQKKDFGYYVLLAANIFYAAVWFYILFFVVRSPALGMVTAPLPQALILVAELFQLVSMLLFLFIQLFKTSGERWFYYFSIVFFLENTWEILYDTGIAFRPFRFAHSLDPFSLIIVIYFATNVILICRFYKKPLFAQSAPISGSRHMNEKTLEEKMAPYSFTKREQELIRLILKGKSNQEIAEDLFISQNTVKHHISNIYKKANIKNRIQLLQLFNSEE